MAEQDIMPYSSTNGGHSRITTSPLDGSSTHLRGEPVRILANGRVSNGNNDPDFTTEGGGSIGIAMVGAQQIADASGDGIVLNSANEPCQICLYDPLVEFYTRNMYDGGVATTFVGSNIGDECNLEIVGAVDWGVDVAPANFNFKITGLLDDDGRDAIRNSTTVTGVRFRLMTTAAQT